jgi:glycosyltransferase involved in cell wall biosynthesis
MKKEIRTWDLFLFTIHYPYGSGETFVENEIKVLSERFKTIYVFPISGSGLPRQMPQNVKVAKWNDSYNYSGKNILKKNWLYFFKILIFEFLHSKDKIKIIRNFAEVRSGLLQNLARAEHLNRYIDQNNGIKPVYYTYWFDDWATVLGVLKSKQIIPHYLSRAHGFDLYSERRKGGFIPFRSFQLATVKKVFVVSREGLSYLCEKYPSQCSKIDSGYLGVFDKGINPFKEENAFTLVSCSNLIPVKRVHLIIEILKNVKIEMNWIHFGTGELMEELIALSHQLPAHIKVDFKGQKSNMEILAFYKAVPVNLFVNVSESEGIPVSIMEAMSFGIPVAATDVGGVSEIVNKNTGFLLQSDFDTLQVSDIINNYKALAFNSIGFREGVKKFWDENFNADKNYNNFYSEIAGDS